MPDRASALRVATWNVHAFVGRDGRFEPERTGEVIRRLDADIIGLQEVAGHRDTMRGESPLAVIAAKLDLSMVFAPTRGDAETIFGNALLTKHQIRHHENVDVSVAGVEARKILDAELEVGQKDLRVLVVHFGLRARERHRQVRALLELVGEAARTPTIVLGDFNEWRPRGPSIAALDAAFDPSRPVRSFPSWLPLLRLDRIWVRPAPLLLETRRFGEPLARIASDHLPVVANIAQGPRRR